MFDVGRSMFAANPLYLLPPEANLSPPPQNPLPVRLLCKLIDKSKSLDIILST
jgi:hypothetical protein